MDEKLSKTSEETPIEELKQISVAMKDYISTENETAMQTVVEKINKKPGLFARLFPNAYEKEQQRITLDRMRTMYKAKKEFFELYTAIQLEIARKQGDALIASVGMELRASLTSFATARIEEVSQTIGASRQRFMQRITPQLDDVENYKAYPDVYEPARQSIKNEIKTYFEGIDELLKGFIEAMKSKVPDSKT